jgi:hypothetical protein
MTERKARAKTTALAQRPQLAWDRIMARRWRLVRGLTKLWQQQILEGNDRQKSKCKSGGIQADDEIVPRCLLRPIPIRCNRAHLTYKMCKCKLLKLSYFQHSSPKLSRSPEIVLRGTISSGADGVRATADSRRE